jgi:hypothetical protein
VQVRSAAESSAIARNRVAATTLGVFSASYALLGVWYLYHDFFKYLGRGMPTTMDGSGYAVQINCYLATVLSPWRVVGLILAAGLLGLSAHRLWQRKPGARALALVTLWGVVAPQILWFTEFVIDWRGGHGLGTTALSGLALVLVPTMILFEGNATLAGWRQMSANRLRLLFTAIASAWVAFGATEFLDHSYQLDSSLAWWGATTAVVLGGLGTYGLLRLRTWGLVAAIFGAASLAVVPLAFGWTQYLPSGGYIDQFVVATSGCSVKSVVSAAVPMALVAGLAAPFLRSFVRKLRD